MMNDFYRKGFWTVPVSIILVAVTGFFSYGAYRSARNMDRTAQETIQSLKQDIHLINSRLEKLDSYIKELQSINPLTAFSGDSSGDASTNGNNSRKGAISGKIAGEEVEKLVESAVSDRLEALGKMDTEVLKEIYDKYRDEKNLNDFLNDLRSINREQHLVDNERYGEELQILYRLAQSTRGNTASAEEREAAFNELITKYPDSYAAVMAVAQKAMLSAMRRNVGEAEKYYNMLMNSANEDAQNVVLDMGVEAMPNIEYNLAWMYYREGRLEESKMMVDHMEENRSGSLVFVRTRRGPPQLRPLSEAVSMIRQNFDNPEQ